MLSRELRLNRLSLLGTDEELETESLRWRARMGCISSAVLLAIKRGVPVPPAVEIPQGQIVLGTPVNKSFHKGNEKELLFELVRRISVAVYPVRQFEFQGVMGWNPSKFQPDHEDSPVERINWVMALQYCNALNLAIGIPCTYGLDANGHYHWFSGPGFRLMSDTEWEYACRAGCTGVRYNVKKSTAIEEGDLDRIASYRDNSNGMTQPCGTREANAWGLQDFIGNVWELCWDVYQVTMDVSSPDPGYPPKEHIERLQNVPLEPLDRGEPGVLGPRERRVARGGDYMRMVDDNRCARRIALTEGYRGMGDGNIGFRVCRSLGSTKEDS